MLILEQAKRLRLVILDACRDNPFVRSMRRTIAGRSIGRGLAEVRVLSADTIIAFAAKAGSRPLSMLCKCCDVPGAGPQELRFNHGNDVRRGGAQVQFTHRSTCRACESKQYADDRDDNNQPQHDLPHKQLRGSSA